MTTKTISKAAQLRNKSALAQARYRARCRVSDGVGGVAEAIAEWAAFEVAWPKLARSVSRIEWMREYRQAPHWQTLAHIEGRVWPCRAAARLAT